jgi:hypothetical protein
VLAIAIILAVLGWMAAGYCYSRLRRRLVEHTPTKAVLLNYAGLPESCRTLKGSAPREYTRPHGRGPATTYARAGIAIVYQATAPRQPQ